MTDAIEQSDEHDDESTEVEHEVCACPSLADLARLGAEERDVPACPIHRPATQPTAPLNGQGLLAVLRAELGDHGTVAHLGDELREALYDADRPEPPTRRIDVSESTGPPRTYVDRFGRRGVDQYGALDRVPSTANKTITVPTNRR